MSASTRRTFVKQAALLVGGASVAPWARLAAADAVSVTAATSAGTVRGLASGGINVFKGIRYGGTTAGKNRFMPPTRPVPWTGTRDALAYGPTAPQTTGAGGARGGGLTESEDCLVLNVFTPALGSGRGRPVMVWLHGGGFSTGSGSGAVLDGTNLAKTSDVVVVTINHRLNVFGFTYLGDAAGSEFALSGGAGMLDIVMALEWVRDNIDRFGGDPNLVTIFGQSGGGRKVATLMAMPGAKGLFHRAIIESGAVLRLTTKDDAVHATELLLAELGIAKGQARDLQTVPMAQLLAANAAVLAKLTLREPGQTANSPTVDGVAIPTHPWDPAGPALSASIPLLIGYARTEETLYDRPTPEKLALDEAGLKLRAGTRIGGDPERVIEAFRKAYPGRHAVGSVDPDRDGASQGHVLARAGKTKGRAGGRAGVLLPLRLGDAGGRRAHAVAAHRRDRVRVQQHQRRGPAHRQDARGPCARRQGQRGVGGLCAHGQSEHVRPADVAGVLGRLARHDAVQQHEPRRAGSGPRRAARDGAGAEAGVRPSRSWIIPR